MYWGSEARTDAVSFSVVKSQGVPEQIIQTEWVTKMANALNCKYEIMQTSAKIITTHILLRYYGVMFQYLEEMCSRSSRDKGKLYTRVY